MFCPPSLCLRNWRRCNQFLRSLPCVLDLRPLRCVLDLRPLRCHLDLRLPRRLLDLRPPRCLIRHGVERSKNFTGSVDVVEESKSEEEEEEEDEDDPWAATSDFEFDESDNELSNEILCKELPRYSDGKNWPYKLSTRERREHHRQVGQTEGFDMKVIRKKEARKIGLIQPALTEKLDDIVSCAKAAVKRENRRRRLYNEDHEEKLNHLRLKGIIKAMSQLLGGEFTYFLTIKVLEGEDEKVYETMMRLYPPPRRGEG